MWLKIRQSKINSSWVAGPIGQTNRRPSVWCSKHYFLWLFIDLGHSKLFTFIFVFFKKNRKIDWKYFCKEFCKKSLKKIILGTSDAWSTIHLSHRPSNPEIEGFLVDASQQRENENERKRKTQKKTSSYKVTNFLGRGTRYSYSWLKTTTSYWHLHGLVIEKYIFCLGMISWSAENTIFSYRIVASRSTSWLVTPPCY